MHREQLVNLIIIPTLTRIPCGLSKGSVLAISMIIAHQSKRGHYLKKLGVGPGLGLIHMGPVTHNHTWRNSDTIWYNALILGIINQAEWKSKMHPLPERLIYDLQYNVFMARQRLFMNDKELPSKIDDISRYLKRHWTYINDKADDMSYRDDYLEWD